MKYQDMTSPLEVKMKIEVFDKAIKTSTILVMNPLGQTSFTRSHNETDLIPWILSILQTKYNRRDFIFFNEIVQNCDIQDCDRINARYGNLMYFCRVRALLRRPHKHPPMIIPLNTDQG